MLVFTLKMFCCVFLDFCDVRSCPTESTCINMGGDDTTCRCNNGFFRLNGQCVVPTLAFMVMSIFFSFSIIVGVFDFGLS